ncbi:MAG: type II secretion system protein [Microthrixaceae bacterium]
MKSRRTQAGATLVEVLIAIALVGILVLALASGMLTLIKTSTETTKQQQVELALGSFTESLKSGPYTKCAVLVPGSPYPGTARWVPPQPGMNASLIKIEYWNPISKSFDQTCPGSVDKGTQRLTIQVDLDNHTSTAQFVKADGSPGLTPAVGT